MRGVIMHGPGDVRVEERADPRIEEPTDAVIRIVAAYVWPSAPRPTTPASRTPTAPWWPPRANPTRT